MRWNAFPLPRLRVRDRVVSFLSSLPATPCSPCASGDKKEAGMTYDSFVAAAVAAEMRSSVLTAWVDGVQQPEEKLLTLSFYGRGGKSRSALSADARRAGVWRTERRRPNPAVAPGFCMLLRKYI